MLADVGLHKAESWSIVSGTRWAGQDKPGIRSDSPGNDLWRFNEIQVCVYISPYRNVRDDDIELTLGSWLTIRPARRWLFSTFGRGELPTRFVTYNFFPHITYKPICRNFPLDCSKCSIVSIVSYLPTSIPSHFLLPHRSGCACQVRGVSCTPKRSQTGFGASDVCDSCSTGIEATSTSFHGLQGIVQELTRWVTSHPILHLFDICVCSYVSVWFISISMTTFTG